MDKMNIQFKTKFVLIGEIHGIRENIDVLKLFINLYLAAKEKFVVALEWPANLSGEINKYLFGIVGGLNWEKWPFINYKDGRISKEHLRFLFWLRTKNMHLSKNRKISIKCFDASANEWDKRDKSMAKNIKLTRGNVLAIMGNFHANKMKFELGGQKYMPLGSFLPQQETMAIKIEYLSGKFYNHKIKTVRGSIKSGLGLKKSKQKGFDYIYVIPKAHPVKMLV